MTKKTPSQGLGASSVLGIGAVAAMVLCCLGPALLVGGGLAALGGGLAAVGGFLSSPLTVVTGLALAGAGLLVMLRRRARREDACCAPGTRPGSDSRQGPADTVAPISPTEGEPR